MNGPEILFHIGDVAISETVRNTWIVMIALTIFAYLGGRKLERVPGKFQIVVETFVGGINGLVKQTMGEKYINYAPYIATVFTVIMLSNLLGLLGLRSPTADLVTTLSFALTTFVLIQLNGLRSKGIGGYVKGFMEPLPALLPINIVGELATPVSLSFRLFGNIAGGGVIIGLLYQVLGWVSEAVFGLPFGLFQIGIPGVLHIYFDLFAGVLQAFIFIMLTMVFVSGAE